MKHKFTITRLNQHEISIASISPLGISVPVGTYAANPFKAWQYALADMQTMGWTLPADKANSAFLVQVSCFDSKGFVQGDVILEKLKSFCFLNIVCQYDRYASLWQKANESESFPTLIVENK